MLESLESCQNPGISSESLESLPESRNLIGNLGIFAKFRNIIGIPEIFSKSGSPECFQNPGIFLESMESFCNPGMFIESLESFWNLGIFRNLSGILVSFRNISGIPESFRNLWNLSGMPESFRNLWNISLIPETFRNPRIFPESLKSLESRTPKLGVIYPSATNILCMKLFVCFLMENISI